MGVSRQETQNYVIEFDAGIAQQDVSINLKAYRLIRYYVYLHSSSFSNAKIA